MIIIVAHLTPIPQWELVQVQRKLSRIIKKRFYHEAILPRRRRDADYIWNDLLLYFANNEWGGVMLTENGLRLLKEYITEVKDHAEKEMQNFHDIDVLQQYYKGQFQALFHFQNLINNLSKSNEGIV